MSFKRKADQAHLDAAPDIVPLPASNTPQGQRVDFILAVEESVRQRIADPAGINDQQLANSHQNLFDDGALQSPVLQALAQLPAQVQGLAQLPAQVQGLTAQVQGLAQLPAQVQGLTAQVQGLTAQVQALAQLPAQVQGLTAQVQGLAQLPAQVQALAQLPAQVQGLTAQVQGLAQLPAQVQTLQNNLDPARQNALLLNSRAVNPDSIIQNIPRLTDLALAPNFPATFEDFNNMNGNDVNRLLQFHGLPTNGTVVDRRRRLASVLHLQHV